MTCHTIHNIKFENHPEFKNPHHYESYRIKEYAVSELITLGEIWGGKPGSYAQAGHHFRHPEAAR